ncbi:DNA-binding protein [Neisseria zoodegmatis]|uniref:DNA-binding protein n=1 Tax=Neisseria zoodegmatis TaxID=326523 RepID=A0A378WGF9_9NEIS|nr:DNA-binding protein [Neisseria zoodegmatis]
MTANLLQPLKETTQFFKTIQNKLHFAATGHTAAELVYRCVNAAKPLMGLTHTTDGVVRKKDIKTAQNYLNEKEISQLNRIVIM